MPEYQQGRRTRTRRVTHLKRGAHSRTKEKSDGDSSRVDPNEHGQSVFHHALREGRDLTQKAHHATQTMPTRAKNQTKNVGEAADAGVPTRPTHAHKKGDAPQAGCTPQKSDGDSRSVDPNECGQEIVHKDELRGAET